jgi:MYXO-CTERM domain-containing protein
MKKLIIALAALSVTAAAYGQGQFVFNNRIGTEVNARFINSAADPLDGTVSTIGSPDWTVQLFGGPENTPVGQLVALDPAGTGFRGAASSAAAGFVTGITPAVPGVGVGGTASILVKVLGPGGYTQDFGPYTVAGLGGGTTTPPNLQLGTSPLLVNVPEPTTLALGALGLGALLLIRRRK